jgi:hypothetical protein
MLHGQRGAALDAGGAVADHPVEFLAQLVHDARHALLRERVLVARLRGRQRCSVSTRLSRISAWFSLASPCTTLMRS